ncbi:MAG TPA: HtaA domain-containing protein, partial [Baekduia sp.]|nr:HtaA domain-containing protein [Baekduia sp.]
AVYNSGTPQRTWLGYVTGDPMLGQAGGSATPTAPATGPTVDTTSPRGVSATYTTVFPSTAGTYDANTGIGTIELDGGLTFTSPVHMFTIAVNQPTIVLNGNSGKIFASGAGGGATPTYDRTQPLLDLDLTGSTVTLMADGSRILSDIVPSIATANWAFPSNYGAGAGPDRDPNTFGSFALTLRLAPDPGPAGPAGPAGVAGPAGPAGPVGPAVTIRSVKAVLAKAPFKGNATRKVSVLNSKGKTLATGTIKGRVLKVTLAKTIKSLSGTVKLKVTNSRSTTTIRIPS